MCRRHYRGKENVRVHQVAVGSTAGQVTTPVGGEYSTADAGPADTYEGIAYASAKLTKTTITAPSTISSRHCSTLPRASTCWWSTSRATRRTSSTGFDIERWRPTMDTHPLHAHSREGSARLGMRIQDAGMSS